jgi:hypothetical protein
MAGTLPQPLGPVDKGTTSSVCVRIDDETREAVDRWCDANGMPRSRALAGLLQNGTAAADRRICGVSGWMYG